MYLVSMAVVLFSVCCNGQTPLCHGTVQSIDHIIFPQNVANIQLQCESFNVVSNVWGLNPTFPSSIIEWPGYIGSFFHAFFTLGSVYGEYMVPRVHGIGLTSCFGFNETQRYLSRVGVEFATSQTGFDIIYILGLPRPQNAPPNDLFGPPQMNVFFVWYPGVDEKLLMKINHRELITNSKIGALLAESVTLKATPSLFPQVRKVLNLVFGYSSGMETKFVSVGGGPDLFLTESTSLLSFTPGFKFQTDFVTVLVRDSVTASNVMGPYFEPPIQGSCAITNTTMLHLDVGLKFCQ